MFGRIYPDGPTETEQEEVQRIILSVSNNNPGLLEEMMPSPSQGERFARSKGSLPVGAAGVLNCSVPLVNRSIQVFGAKLGFALHYTTMRRIISPTGGVVVRWFSNYDAATDGIPADLFELLGPPQTLTQGKWSAGDQFKYAFAVAQNVKSAAYFSTFRQSFAVLSWISEDADDFALVKVDQVHRPGKFR